MMGSYVFTSTLQFEHLVKSLQPELFEVSVPELIKIGSDPLKVSLFIHTLAESIDQDLKNDKLVLLYSSRNLVSGTDREKSLDINNQVAYCLRQIVSQVQCRPRYVIGKGGVTSHEIAAFSLGIHKALVKGQIVPGVPLWLAGENSRFPGLVYGVFPGNIGGPESLTQAVIRFESNNSRKPR